MYVYSRSQYLNVLKDKAKVKKQTEALNKRRKNKEKETNNTDDTAERD